MQDFYKGMDVSFVPQCLDEGMEAKDFDGTVLHPLALAKKYGVNGIRLRIWNKPENVPPSKGYCSLEHTIKMAKQIKEYGMEFMLDFHYSDFWADPGQQRKPKDWEQLTGEELEKAVYTYTKETLLTLRGEGVLPQMVQIGNEIRSGLLFPDGEVPNYKGMVGLVNAGIRGAREAAEGTDMQIMIHLDQGGRYLIVKEWFEQAFANGLADFDVIGLSYYPFWHGTFMDLKDTMEKLVQDYGKPIIVAETAHAWRKSKHGFIDEVQEQIAGVPATPQGQKKVLDLVMSIVASLPDNMGKGIYYWEPLCVPKEEEGGWSENMGVLDESGMAMEAIRAFEFTREDYDGTKPAKVYHPKEMTILKGTVPKLPEELHVLYYDGITRKCQISWEKKDLAETGTYTIEGTVAETGLVAEATVHVVDEIVAEENLVRDPNWNNGFTEWQLSKSDEKVSALIDPEMIDPFPAPPVNALKVQAPMNFTFTVSQTIELPEEGDYRLKVWYRGIDTTNVDIKLFFAKESGEETLVIHPTDDDWTLYEMKKVSCKAEKVTIGIRMVTPPIFGKMRGFCLEKI